MTPHRIVVMPPAAVTVGAQHAVPGILSWCDAYYPLRSRVGDGYVAAAFQAGAFDCHFLSSLRSSAPRAAST
jgi:hypothetical protein